MRLISFASFAWFLLVVPTGLVAQPPEPPPPSTTEAAETRLVRSMIESLADSDWEVRQHLGIALSKVGPSAVPGLIEALKDRNADRRAGAAYALSQMKQEARPAMVALTEALRDSETKVRRQAAYALSRIVERNGAILPPAPTLSGEIR